MKTSDLTNYDSKVLSDVTNMDADSLRYYANATAFLAQYLHNDSKLKKKAIFEETIRWLSWIKADKGNRPRIEPHVVSGNIHRLGTIGLSLYHCRKNISPQLKTELTRMADNPYENVGNWFLFYITGMMAANGYEIEFIKEESNGIKTPDFSATKGKKRLFIEANAKQPKVAVDSPERLRFLIRDIINEKRLKFKENRFWPGVIVADITPAYELTNDDGSLRTLKLKKDLVKWDQDPIGGKFRYPVYDDHDFFNFPENTDNTMSYLINEMANIDLKDTQVVQCLLAMSRMEVRSGTSTSFPKGHQLIIRKGYEHLEMKEIAGHRYIV